MKFIKAHTNGNDFIITSENINIDEIKILANRQTGIGCDQLIYVFKKNVLDYKISFFNQDGSCAKMCGNGLIATTLYIQSFLEKNANEFNLFVENEVYKSSIQNNVVSIMFPRPKLIEQKNFSKIISTGNMHLVCEADDILYIPDTEAQELHKQHPDCNIHFIKQIEDKTIRMKSFERGVGWTKACGSGALAVAFSTELFGEINIVHDGGNSKVIIEKDKIFLKAIPTMVFSGETL